jgi:hypothetical protein
VSVSTLQYFIASLHDEGLASSLIFSIVSAITFVHRLLRMPDPANDFVTKKMLQGCKKSKPSVDSRRPITQEILGELSRVCTLFLSGIFEQTRFKAVFSGFLWVTYNRENYTL